MSGSLTGESLSATEICTELKRAEDSPSLTSEHPMPDTNQGELGGGATAGRLLTVPEAAGVLNVGERFVRRLVAERRITVVHVGRHVRIPESAVAAFVEAGTVLPFTSARRPVSHLGKVA